jgi:hypothetical protein
MGEYDELSMVAGRLGLGDLSPDVLRRALEKGEKRLTRPRSRYSPDEIKELRARARRTAEICGSCFRPLGPMAPISKIGIHRAWPNPAMKRRGGISTASRLGFSSVPLCVNCSIILGATRNYGNRWHHQDDRGQHTRCEGCNRPIRTRTWQLRWKWFVERTCCDECEAKVYRGKDRERHRVKHDTIRCVVCGEMFTPRRRDARTCSNRCRQTEHRRRIALRKAGIEIEKPRTANTRE